MTEGGGNAQALRAIEEIVAAIDYPMYILTAASRGERAGCLVGFATQASIRPPRFLVCVSDKNRTHAVVRHADAVVVHLVPADGHELAELFGGETGDEVDKFARCEWTPGPGGAPILAACGNWFAARVLERLPAGDHTALLLDPFDAASDGGERPFTFHRARRIEAGHEA